MRPQKNLKTSMCHGIIIIHSIIIIYRFHNCNHVLVTPTLIIKILTRTFVDIVISAKHLKCFMLTFPAEVRQGDSLLYFSSSKVNKCMSCVVDVSVGTGLHNICCIEKFPWEVVTTTLTCGFKGEEREGGDYVIILNPHKNKRSF